MTPQSKQSLIAALHELERAHPLTNSSSVGKVIALTSAVVPMMRENMNTSEIIAFFASNLVVLLDTDVLSRPGILKANDVVQAATKIVQESDNDQ